MPNEDRISEVYRGELWSQAGQELARERIHWMCSQSAGRVLDLGCSQGIASILVGREGLTAAGVDHELSRLVHGRGDLAREDPWVRRRVGFFASEGRDLPFRDQSFDTTLLGEVLEHLVLPHELLDEIHRVLRPSGRLVITTPAGYHPYHDHKASFFPASLCELVGKRFVIDTLELTERYLLLTARRPAPGETAGGAEGAILASQGALEERMLAFEKDHNALRTRVAALRSSVERLERELEAELARGRTEKGRLEELAATQAKAAEAFGRELAETRSRLGELGADSERFEAERDAARAELARTGADREGDRAQLRRVREQLAETRWWLRTERSRRWWRIGKEIGDAGLSPLGLLRLPLRLFRVITTPIEAEPHPTRSGSGLRGDEG